MKLLKTLSGFKLGPHAYSGPAQYAALVAMYPFITYFSLFDLAQQAARPQVFDLIPQIAGTAGSDEGQQDQDQINAILVFFFTGYVPAVIHCLWRRCWGWLLIGMAAAHFTLIDLAGDFGVIDLGAFRETAADLPMIGVKISFLWIVLRGKIRSASFLVYCLTSAALTSLLAQASGYDGLDALRQVMPLVVFVMTVALARLIIFAYTQNKYFLKLLGWKRGGHTLGHTLVLWTPILAFAYPYFAITDLIRDTVEDAAYDQRKMLIHPYDEEMTVGCTYLNGPDAYLNILARRHKLASRGALPKSEGTKKETRALLEAEIRRPEAVAAQREAGTNLRRNTMYSIYRFYGCKLQEWEDKASAFEKRARGAPYHRLSDEFKLHYNQILTDNIPMKAPNYSGFGSSIKNWSVRQMQGQINSAYAFIRDSARERMARKIDTLIEPKLKETGGRVGDGVVELRKLISPMFHDANRTTQISVWWVFSTFSALHMFAIMLFTLLCIKSLMYVYGRVAFAADAGAFMTLGDPANPNEMPHGGIRITGQDYELSRGAEGTFFFARRFQPHGMPPRFSIPQPAGAPIARLLHRSMTMNRFEFDPAKEDAKPQSLHFTVTGSKTFVEWTLAEGETIVFDFANFVGMAGSVKLSTLISVQISTLLLGKFVFSTATGPGRVVLLTGGRPKTGEAPETAVSMPPERLVAWQRDMRFHIDSSLAIADIYLSTAYIRKEGQGQLIMDVDKQNSTGSGLSRFVLRFLWPG